MRHIRIEAWLEHIVGGIGPVLSLITGTTGTKGGKILFFTNSAFFNRLQRPQVYNVFHSIIKPNHYMVSQIVHR